MLKHHSRRNKVKALLLVKFFKSDMAEAERWELFMGCVDVL